jgi:hypothetical protein
LPQSLIRALTIVAFAIATLFAQAPGSCPAADGIRAAVASGCPNASTKTGAPSHDKPVDGKGGCPLCEAALDGPDFLAPSGAVTPVRREARAFRPHVVAPTLRRLLVFSTHRARAPPLG